MQPSDTIPRPGSGPRNALARETSPYLLQHAANPVDWYPWSEEALALARRENKPILLSIGYSACHWCHVMAHESFEDPATADLMNELFVNIKVDREERPDLDRIYQLAHQMLIQRGGGWPLTMFLSPLDQRPFFGGTYFPKDARYGMPAFGDLLRRVAEFYRTRTDDIAQQSVALQRAFDEITPPPAAADTALTAEPIAVAREMLAQEFDTRFGGFGSAPKFPHPANIALLLRAWRATAMSDEPDLHALYMATLTLTRMSEGGLYDQLGGGFARYSVDQFWMIPHFEKMLYDNGQLLHVAAQAAVATGESLFSRVAGETADWIIRDMQSPQGGYWSTLDADSEGHEGRFYVWEPPKFARCLSSLSTTCFPDASGSTSQRTSKAAGICTSIARSMRSPPNSVSHGRRIGRTIAGRPAIVAALRNHRVWPGRDEKVLTSWNGLAIAGMAVAARALARPDLIDSAVRAVDFIRTALWRDGRLLAVNKDGQSRFTGYLDDYAFLLDGLLELLQIALAQRRSCARNRSGGRAADSLRGS